MPVPLKDRFKPVAQLDLKRLHDFCLLQSGCSWIGEALPRQEVKIVGEIRSLRIVPRAGSPSLEASITDGSGTLVAVWMGRRRIAGIAPGKRLIISGRGTPTGPRGTLLFYNPNYELL